MVVLLVVGAGCVAPASPTPADRPGYENGYAYDDPIDIDSTDGLTAEEREKVVARAMARVERIRGIEFQLDVPVRVITREEYRQQVTGGGDDGPGGEETYQQVKHEALFLVGGNEDAIRREQENNAAAVQGYYDVGDDEIVIVADGETPVIDEVTLAQELFHAYQFRHLVPDRLPRGATDDTIVAWRAVIEGDANLVDRIYERRCRTEWNCLRERPSDRSTGDDDGPGIHRGIYLLQYFPYAEGEGYVRTLRAEGGWERVNELYEDMPTSTEQVIDGSGDPPTRVTVPDRSTDDWERVERSFGRRSGTVGQYGIAAMFGYTVVDEDRDPVVERSAFLNTDGPNGSAVLNYGVDPASGWAGDRLYPYRNERGETAYVWQIEWDTEAEAREFVTAYERILEDSGARRLDGSRYAIASGPFADAYSVRRSGRTVTIVNAPSAETLQEVHGPRQPGVRPLTASPRLGIAPSTNASMVSWTSVTNPGTPSGISVGGPRRSDAERSGPPGARSSDAGPSVVAPGSPSDSF